MIAHCDNHGIYKNQETSIGLLYQDLIKEKQFTAGKMLPPVLPIVLYNGDSAWKAATNINELIYSIPGGLAKYHPSLQYLLLSEACFYGMVFQGTLPRTIE